MSHNFVNPVDIVDSTDTTKKIRLDPSASTTNTTATITSAQVTNRTYAIPDSGANASFVMTEGSQTLVGTKTFTTGIVIKETSGSDTITINAPALAAPYTLTLPPNDGTSNNEVLTTDGSGVLSWQSFLPAGMLLPFAGSSTPSGFLLCDGSAISRTTYANLFTAIGTLWGVGDGSTTFNIPLLSRRTLVGSGGSGTGTLANTTGSTGGAETHVLSTAELATHTHGAGTLSGSSSVADPGHIHSVNIISDGVSANHRHSYPSSQRDDGDGGNGESNAPYDSTSGTGNPYVINNNGNDGVPGYIRSSIESGDHTHVVSGTTGSNTTGITVSTTISGSTGSTGSNTAHNNMQPSAVVTYVIKF